MAAINARCGASQQSIAEGDRCRVVVISQSASYNPIVLEAQDKQLEVTGIANSTVYLNCLWQPVSPFLRAVYDDYGMTKLILETNFDRAQAATLFAKLTTSLAHTLPGKNSCHDLEVDFPAFVNQHAPGLAEIFKPRKWFSPPVVLQDDSLDAELQKCWDYLCDMVRRHLVFGQSNSNQLRPYEMFIVHERAYQGLVQTIYESSDWEGNTWEMGAYLRRSIAATRAEVEAHKQASKGADGERFAAADFMDRLRSQMERYDIDRCFTNRVARFRFDRLADKLYDNEISEDAFVAEAELLMRDRAAICGMERFKLVFGPMTYVGADFTNRVGSAYAEFVTKVGEQVTRDRPRDDDDADEIDD